VTEIQGGTGNNQVDASIPRIPANLQLVDGSASAAGIERYLAPKIDGGVGGENGISFSSSSQGVLRYAPRSQTAAEKLNQTYPVVGMKSSVLVDLGHSTGNSYQGKAYYVPIQVAYWSVYKNGVNGVGIDDGANAYFDEVYPKYNPEKDWPTGLETSSKPGQNVPHPDLKLYASWKKVSTLDQNIAAEQQINNFKQFTGTGQGDCFVTYPNHSTVVAGVGGNSFIVTPKEGVSLQDGNYDDLSGGTGDDTIIAFRKALNTPENEYVYNKLNGGGGDDLLVGATGQNYVDAGGPGHATLSGDLGDSKNIYIFGRGYGDDTIDFSHTYTYTGWSAQNGFDLGQSINNAGATRLTPKLPLTEQANPAPTVQSLDYHQTIYFKDDITVDQLNFSRSSNDLVIGFQGTNDKLTINTGSVASGSTGISNFVFSNGTIIGGLYDISKTDFITVPSGGNYSSGTSGQLLVGLGNNTIKGSTAYSDIVLGSGDNTLNSTSGKETIIIARHPSTDTIKLDGSSGDVTLQFEGSINLDDLKFALTSDGKFEITVGYGGNQKLSNQKIVFDSTLQNLSKIKDLKLANGLDLPLSSVFQQLFNQANTGTFAAPSDSETLHFGKEQNEDDYHETYYVYTDGELATPIPVHADTNVTGSSGTNNAEYTIRFAELDSPSPDPFPSAIVEKLDPARANVDFKTGTLVFRFPDFYGGDIKSFEDNLLNGPTSDFPFYPIINHDLDGAAKSLEMFLENRHSNGYNDTAQLVIVDRNAPITASFSQEEYKVSESSGKFVDPMIIKLDRAPQTEFNCTIKVIDPKDRFTQEQVPVTFEPGQTEAIVPSFPVIDDQNVNPEEDKHFNLELLDNTSKLMGITSLYINDDDAAHYNGDQYLDAADIGLPILSGGFGNDTLVGTDSSNILIADNGNDVLRGASSTRPAQSGSLDTYVIQTGGGMNRIEYSPNAAGKVVLCTNQAQANVLDPTQALLPGEVWFHKDGNNLDVYLRDVKHGVTIDDWFNPSNKIDTFDVVNQVNGYYEINRSGVNTLLGMMDNTTSFEAPWTPKDYYQSTSQEPFPQTTALGDAIAADWTLTPSSHSIF